VKKEILAVLCVALLSSAEARLGQTVEEIEASLGGLKVVDDPSCPQKLLFGVAHRKEGFNELSFYFAKTNRRCLELRYGKSFAKLEDVNVTFEDARKIVEETFPRDKLAIVDSTGIKNGKQVAKLWNVRWKTKNGSVAQAAVQTNRYTSIGGCAFVVECHDLEYERIR